MACRSYDQPVDPDADIDVGEALRKSEDGRRLVAAFDGEADRAIEAAQDGIRNLDAVAGDVRGALDMNWPHQTAAAIGSATIPLLRICSAKLAKSPTRSR